MTQDNDRIIYLDNNATTAVAPEVFEAMTPYLTKFYGNPSSIHTFGGQIASHIEEAREKVAKLLGAASSEIIFTSCGTESDSAAILSALGICRKKNKIVCSTVEHAAILNLTQELERKGYEIVRIPVDSKGRLDMEFAEQVIDTDTAIVSVILMRSTSMKGDVTPFIMELPTYRKPQAVSLLLHVWDKLKHFLEKAFKIRKNRDFLS